MNPEYSENMTAETSVLADELGSLLKEDMRTGVEALLDGFLEDMKDYPRSVFQEASAKQESMLKALDEQLRAGEEEETRFEQEFERLRAKAEIAQQGKAAAEKEKGRVEEALHRSMQEEKSKLESVEEARLRGKAEAERVSERHSEILSGQLRSSRRVSKILAGVLLVLILVTIGYLAPSRSDKERGAATVDPPIEERAVGIAPKAVSEGTLAPAQAPIVAGQIEPDENAAALQLDDDRPVVEPRPTPEPPKPETLPPMTLAEIYYLSGSIDIPEDMSNQIRSMAETFRDKSGARIHIEGYSDDKHLRQTIVGRYTDNIGLSQARAGAIARLFIISGMTPERISIIGMGADRPFVPNDSPENRAKNRRSVIRAIYGSQ